MYLRTALAQSHQIPAYPLKLPTRHRNRRSILRLRNTQMLLINIHKLNIILAQPIGLCALKHQIHDIGRVFCFEREDILVVCGAQDFRERGEVDAERDVPVASEGAEGGGVEEHADERYVAVVHGLEGNAGVVAVEVAVLD